MSEERKRILEMLAEGKIMLKTQKDFWRQYQARKKKQYRQY